MTTDVILHGQARKKILKGVNLVADAVKMSLGPEGGAALIHRSFNRGARLTNDGVTIAKCIEPKDEFINLVTTVFKEAASRTGERAGDGTTTTIVIAQKLINDAFSNIKDNDKTEIQLRGMENEKGTQFLKKHILSEIPKIKEEIKKISKKIKSQEELKKIANVALNDNLEVAKIVADMVWKTGENGFITLGDAFQGKLETSIIEGARFPMKIAAPRFLNNPDRYEMIAEDCPVIVTNYGIDSLRDFADFWNSVKQNKLIIFAPSFSDEILVQMVKLIAPRPLPNGGIVPSGIQIFPVKIPSLRTEQIDDLAIFVDAAFIDKNTGKKLKDIKDYDLGFLEKLTVKSVEDREDAELLGGKGVNSDKVKDRIKTLKEQITKTKLPEHKAILEKRIASLASSGGMIKVGAATDAEALPLKHKIEDAIYASQNAMKYGYVEGGGLTLKKIAEKFYKDDLLIRDALSAPYNQIQENYGSELKIEKDIIDPARVVELEVEHAFSVAANMIVCKAIIAEFNDRDNQEGNKEIAKALMTYTRFWAKREGLITEGKMEAEQEQLERHERLMAKEND